MTRAISLVITEGALETVVAERLLAALDVRADDCQFVDQRGRTNFWPRVPKYNVAAQRVGPILGLADLESEPCPGVLIQRHLPTGVHQDFVLRLAVRMLESWLLADRESMAGFLEVSDKIIVRSPESLPNPKQFLVNLARRSRSRDIRADLVPEPRTSGIVGKNYTGRMSEFIRKFWRPFEAEKWSKSLTRAIAAIRTTCDS